MIDLHTHSTASDGTLSPTELIELAKEKGLSLICLTDHDTTDGLEEARKICKREEIRFLGGIELDVNFPNGEFHLLGIGLQDWSGSMQEMLKEVQHRREHRNIKMIRRFQENGYDVNWDSLKRISGSRLIGRPHFAQLLVEKGIVKNKKKAFEIYLNSRSPYYFPKEGIELKEGIEWIQKAGGIPILAHPLSLYLGWEKLSEGLKTWISWGIQGIEAYHSAAKLRHCHRLAALADELGIISTAGSDFHGPGRRDRKLGYTAGMRKIDPSAAEPFLQLCI